MKFKDYDIDYCDTCGVYFIRCKINTDHMSCNCSDCAHCANDFKEFHEFIKTNEEALNEEFKDDECFIKSKIKIKKYWDEVKERIEILDKLKLKEKE